MNEPLTYPATENSQGACLTPETINLSADLMDYFRQYAREKPEVVALWCVGIGFVLGWKLKPW
jgi:hypothetical protein